MFQAKYKYRANCTICHDRDSWELNRYGKGFAKQGRTLAALAALESGDHDEDGAASGVEIQAKSNPGDPRSTPARLGEWLKNLLPPQPPRKHLAALFPGGKRFVLQESELGASTRARVERELKRPLRDEETFPVYFQVFQGPELLGAALYGSAALPGDCAFLAGYALPANGPVALAGLRPLECKPKGLKSPAFIDLLRGKDAAALGALRAPLGKDSAAAQAVIDAVQGGAGILEALR